MLEDTITECAQRMIDAGFRVIPLSQQSKQPIVKWQLDSTPPISKWDFKRANVAMLTGEANGYVVVDCDTKESYKGWLKFRPRTPLRVKTRKGMHFYYRHPGKYVMSNSHIVAPEGFKYDVKGDKSYCVMPPSISKGHQYQICVCTGNIDGNWLRPSKLPEFDPAWRPETTFKSTIAHSQGIKDVQAYLSKIHVSEGERDKKTYRAAMLCLENNLSELDAAQILTQWHSTNVSPPWEAIEIIEKVRRVYARRR